MNVGPCHQGTARPQVADRGTAPIWRVAVNKMNNKPRTADEGWFSSFRLDGVLTTPLRKKEMLRITHKVRCYLWRQNNPEVNYYTTRISGGCF